MCGRYSNAAAFSEIRLALEIEQLEFFRDWQPAYNVCPTHAAGFEQLIVTRTREGKRAVRLARWSMIPWFWKKPLKSLPASFNARAEEIESRPFWRDAFRSSRCLVPATGWREFSGAPGKKQPHHFHLGHEVFAFAGLWSTWLSADGEIVDSFAIVTTQPSAAAAEIHDRMPLVLPAASYDAWIDPAQSPAPVLAAARSASLVLPLDVYTSNPVGNSVRFEGPEVIEPFEPRPEPVQQALFAEAPRPRPSKRAR